MSPIRDNHFKLSRLLLASSSVGASGPADSWKEPPSQVQQAKVEHRDQLCSLSMGLQGPQKPVPTTPADRDPSQGSSSAEPAVLWGLRGQLM